MEFIRFFSTPGRCIWFGKYSFGPKINFLYLIGFWPFSYLFDDSTNTFSRSFLS